MEGRVSHAECQEWANGSAIWVTLICGQFPYSAGIVGASTLVRCVRFLDLPKQVKQKDVKLMLTFSRDSTAFCFYLLDRESFVRTFFMLLFPLKTGWFCWKRAITAILCHVFQSDIQRCVSFALPVGAHLYSNGSLCLSTRVDTQTNICFWPHFFFSVLSFVSKLKKYIYWNMPKPV